MVQSVFGGAVAESSGKLAFVVTTVSAAILTIASNTAVSRDIIISNTGNRNVWVSTDGPAIAGEGILVPKGDISPPFSSLQEVTVVTSAATSPIAVWFKVME